MYNDTIFALSTIFGKSGIAVFRISGPNALKVIEHLHIKTKIIPKFVQLVDLYKHDDEQFLIDNAILIYFQSPNSFTGSDTVEIQTHGSIAVINILNEEFSKIFRIANPGEFSRMAFINGKMDLTQAEGLIDLINAETEIQAQQATQQMSGILLSLYGKWRKDIISIIANIEAYIEFQDAEIPEETIEETSLSVHNLVQEISNHTKHKSGEILRNGIIITILGKPNVGKSTLLNHLAQRDIAITSNIPGTTRDTIEVKLDIAGYPVTLIDTAGIHDSTDKIECEGIRRAINKAKLSNIKLILFDSQTIDHPQDIMDLIDNQSICVATKNDTMDTKKIIIKEKELLAISVHNNIGITELLENIEQHIKNQMTPISTPVPTRTRHRQLLKEAIKNLLQFNTNKPIELAAEDLYYAAKSIEKITGIIAIDEILAELFSTFCIGK